MSKKEGSVVVDEVVAKGNAVYDEMMERAPEVVSDIRGKKLRRLQLGGKQGCRSLDGTQRKEKQL